MLTVLTVLTEPAVPGLSDRRSMDAERRRDAADSALFAEVLLSSGGQAVACCSRWLVS
ncbi:MAG TPA: hypothetical protein VK217_09175 [Acidimicrobiales bacterium]|nr:hypothetical protein [Acidimicrobiales bacterium]